jgi:hypothetical protein
MSLTSPIPSAAPFAACVRIGIAWEAATFPAEAT